MMKLIKWSWELCNVNPKRLALASAKIEDPKKTKGRQAIKKTHHHLGVLRRSRQVIWMSGKVGFEECFPGQYDLTHRILIIDPILPQVTF